MKKRRQVLSIEGNEINVTQINGEDYICLTDLVKDFGGDQAIYNWLRNRNTVEFLGIWESLNNPSFKGGEFDTFKKQSGLNSFHLTPRKWIEATSAIGLVSKSGRYGGGTYAHHDIAFEFGTWLSPTLKLLIIKEFQRLKADELSLKRWDSRRYLTKINYGLQTLAVRDYLIPQSKLPKNMLGIHYADEADLLNVIIFGQTANEWKLSNSQEAKRSENQRDHATINQLAILANLESLNSMFISQGKNQEERAILLVEEATRQAKALRNNQTSNGAEKSLKIDKPKKE